MLNVAVAGLIGLVFIQSLGSIGIGTLIAAYFIGKIVGWMMKNYQHHLLLWSGQGKTINDEIVEETDDPYEEEYPDTDENPVTS